jgi:hypothetical protein
MATAFNLPPADPKDRTPAFEQAWDKAVKDSFARFTGEFPQFYDPTADDAPTNPGVAIARWPAFPRQLLRPATSGGPRWKVADENRSLQDEYCEWVVERDGDLVTAVTFTTEVPEYWEQLARANKARFRELYNRTLGVDVDPDDLLTEDGFFPQNDANFGNPERIAHLAQDANSLDAAVQLAAEATVLRERNEERVTDQQDLVCCGALGEPLRGSDPQIAIKVNRQAAAGAEISLQNPVGLYIDRFRSNGIESPDGTDASEFWHIERGTEEHTLRARFEVRGKPYQVGDLTVEGRRIEFGAQLAGRVIVRITALAANAGKHSPTEQPCIRTKCPELGKAARVLPV